MNDALTFSPHPIGTGVPATQSPVSGQVAPAHTVDQVYGNSHSLAYRARRRRFGILMPLIERIIARKGSCRIADIGGTEYYWDIIGDFVARKDVEIHLLNIEPQSPQNRDKFIGHGLDAAHLDRFAEGSFDLVHSNSVIEHVGRWDDMKEMAHHMRRLAPSYYVQTPSFWFFLEPHFRFPFFHFLPEQIRFRLLMHFNLGFGGKRTSVDAAMEATQSACLLDKTQMQTLFPDAKIRRERFMGFTKSYMAIREEI